MSRVPKSRYEPTAWTTAPSTPPRVGSVCGPRALLLAAFVAVGLAPWSGSSLAANPRCTYVKIAELPTRLVRNLVIVEGAINGRTVNVVLDTGAVATMIPRPVAERMGLVRQKVQRYRMFGVGGETDVESAIVDEFRLGDGTAKGRRMIVAGEHDFGGDISVILGEDFFHAVDVEFDLAHDAVRLFRPADCDGTSLAYWAPNGASEIPIERVNTVSPHIVLTVRVNGEPVRALFDSGALTSVLDRPEASRLGVSVATPGDAAGKLVGIGPATVDWSVGQVQSIVIGDESIKNTKIRVAELRKNMRYTSSASRVSKAAGEGVSMVLGVDFLISHRVLVAHSQQKMYFTYVGGRVFDWADAAASRSDPDRAVADYDAAIRSNPQDAEAYFRRANAWYEKNEYDRAIADYGRAIEIDPKLAQAHIMFAWLLATAERPAVRDGRRAVASAQTACELTQWKDPAYIDTLAAAYARAGNFEEAVKWQRKAMEDSRMALNEAARERLRSYEAGKAWPSD